MIDMAKIDPYLLIQGDCFRNLKQIPDESVDLILTDPPYNLAAYSTGNMKFDWRADRNNDLADWDLVVLDPLSLVSEFKRILSPKGNIFIFCSYNLLGAYHQAFDPVFSTFQFMVWHKTNPVPNFRKSSFLNSCELIVSCWNKGHTWNFTSQGDMHNFIECPICMGKERIRDAENKNLHPTQKPVAVLKKHIFVDPSIGIAALGLGPDYFNNDLDLFGHVFENMVLRDLLVYASAHNAHVIHYADDTGLEADAVYQMEDGRYALIEIKTGVNKIPEAEKSLLKFKDVIKTHNEEALNNPEHPRAVYREPSALIVICATAPIGYTTDAGVKIVPIGCLKD